MRSILKTIFCLVFLACSFTTLSAKSCIGTWTYTAPNAPYSYYTGSVKFTQKDTSIYANIVIGDVRMDPIKVKKADGNYILDFYLDDSNVCVTFVPKTKDHYTGTAVVDGSEIDVELNRTVSKAGKSSEKSDAKTKTK